VLDGLDEAGLVRRLFDEKVILADDGEFRKKVEKSTQFHSIDLLRKAFQEAEHIVHLNLLELVKVVRDILRP
jgi:hypothetical protein